VVRYAYNRGVNLFDTAETYENGDSADTRAVLGALERAIGHTGP